MSLVDASSFLACCSGAWGGVGPHPVSTTEAARPVRNLLAGNRAVMSEENQAGAAEHRRSQGPPRDIVGDAAAVELAQPSEGAAGGRQDRSRHALVQLRRR